MIENLNIMVRDDLDLLALNIDVPTISNITNKPKNSNSLINDISEKLGLLKQEDVYSNFVEIFTKGKFDAFIFKANQTTMPLTNAIDTKFNTKIEKGVTYYIPKTVDWLFDECIIIKAGNTISCIRKHLKTPLQIGTCRSILKNYFGLESTPAYTINLLRNIFKDLKNKDLACSFGKHDNRNLILFYNSHAADGKYLTISSKLISTNEKITKDYHDSEGALDTVTVLQDFLKKSKDNTSIEKLIEYFILSSPPEVIISLVELKFDILLIKNGTKTVRYKVNLKKSELKILNIDSSLEDVNSIINMLLKIKGVYDAKLNE